MITKLSLKIHKIPMVERIRLQEEFALAIAIHNLLAKLCATLKSGELRPIPTILNELAGNRIKYAPPISETKWADIKNIFDDSVRMASAIRCAPFADNIILLCVWFGSDNKPIGDLMFCVGKEQVLCSYTPAKFIRYFTGV